MRLIFGHFGPILGPFWTHFGPFWDLGPKIQLFGQNPTFWLKSINIRLKCKKVKFSLIFLSINIRLKRTLKMAKKWPKILKKSHLFYLQHISQKFLKKNPKCSIYSTYHQIFEKNPLLSYLQYISQKKSKLASYSYFYKKFQFFSKFSQNFHICSIYSTFFSIFFNFFIFF